MLIIGPPGVGKSEQAKRIADYYDDAVTLGPIDSVLSWAVAEGKACADAITDFGLVPAGGIADPARKAPESGSEPGRPTTGQNGEAA